MSIQIKKRIFLGKNDSIIHYENNLVTLRLANGEVYEKLEPRKLFPVSRGGSYITLLNTDGKEIAVIRDMDELDIDSAVVVENSLNDYYLVPFITGIISITEKSGTLTWRVKTNRGEKSFEIRNRNHDIRVYSDGCIRIRDADDNRYIIEDYYTLDKHSLHLLSSDL